MYPVEDAHKLMATYILNAAPNDENI